MNEGFATSPDGLRWTKLDVPRIPSSDEANFSHDPGSGLFIHTVKRGGPHGRSLAIAFSDDFAKWTDLGIVFHADDEDQTRGRANIAARVADPTLEPLRYVDNVATNVDVYNMGVFRYEGLYVGLPTMYHATGRVPNYPNTDGFDLIQLAVSRDLKTWTRLGDRQPFLGPSRTDSGAYDLTQLLSPSAPVVRDDEFWFYYTGLKYRSNFDYKGTYPNGTADPRPRPIGGHGRGLPGRPEARRLRLARRRRRCRGASSPAASRSPPAGWFVNVESRGGEFRAELESEDGKTAGAVQGSSPPTWSATPLEWESGEASPRSSGAASRSGSPFATPGSTRTGSPSDAPGIGSGRRREPEPPRRLAQDGRFRLRSRGRARG